MRAALRFVAMTLPYVILFSVGYWFADTVSSSFTEKEMGFALQVAGIVFLLVDTMFWKHLDADITLLNTPLLHTREAIELEKVVEKRSAFLRRRWVYSFAGYLLTLAIASAVVWLGLPARQAKWIIKVDAGLFLSTFPALVTFVWARLDVASFRRRLKTIEREQREVKEALQRLDGATTTRPG